MLLSTGNSDKSGSNEDGSSVFNHYVCFVVSGSIKFKQKIGGKELRSTKTCSDGGVRPAGEHGCVAEVFISELLEGSCVVTEIAPRELKSWRYEFNEYRPNRSGLWRISYHRQ